MKRKPFSLILLILSLAMFFSYHIYYYCLENKSNEEVTMFLEEENDVTPQKVELLKNDNSNEIWGVLAISKIHLQKVFYHLQSNKNSVNIGLEVLEGSLMPNIANSSFFIAAHSGNSYLGYFKKLYQLSIGDEVRLIFNQGEYLYTVSQIMLQDKNGVISVDKKRDNTILVLTTCSKEKDKQLVVVSTLIKSTVKSF